jgi:hypothetical protein
MSILYYCFRQTGILVSQKWIEQHEGTELSHVVSFKGRGGGIAGFREPVLGRGAGSFANHSDFPNADFFRHELGIFLRAKTMIVKGQWITVSYGNKFLASQKGRAAHKLCPDK